MVRVVRVVRAGGACLAQGEVGEDVVRREVEVRRKVHGDLRLGVGFGLGFGLGLGVGVEVGIGVGLVRGKVHGDLRGRHSDIVT